MLPSMFIKTLSSSSSFFFFLLLVKLITTSSSSTEDDCFTFNGFSSANLTLDGVASVSSNGLLELTSQDSTHLKGHAFRPLPLRFKSTATGKLSSFSTSFVFAILSDFTNISGSGIAFLISPTANFSTEPPDQYLGLFTADNNGNPTNHIFAIELDTIQNPEFQDIDDNHVGIDINGMKSKASHTAGYYEDGTGLFKNLTLITDQPMQVWIDYDSKEMQLNVTLAPMRLPKPNRPLLATTIDLASLMLDNMHVGFSSTNGAFLSSHCILGWSFKMNGVADALDYARLPSLPVAATTGNSTTTTIVTRWLLIVLALCSFLVLVFASVGLIVRRRIKYAELLEDWELDYGPHRISYKDLFRATKGFDEKGLLGTGGFGRVYRGVLPSSKKEVAVKRVSHESSQGMREFVAEIVSIGQLRHRNLVQLLGYCRRKRELLLVYDFTPNGSLDKYLYGSQKPALSWAQRFRIIKGVASGLLYLHEDWEQVVIHRDIKASNVLLDGEMNARVGDFGLAKLYDRDTDPQTTRIVGTMGYLAPELAMTGKATTITDVFAFGVFLLEVVCGRRPIDPAAKGEEIVLVDWVLESWRRGLLTETIDPKLRVEYYSAGEAELALKLGLLCLHPNPGTRPSMRQVMQVFDGDAELSELLPSSQSFVTLSLYHNTGFDDYLRSISSSAATLSSPSLTTGR